MSKVLSLIVLTSFGVVTAGLIGFITSDAIESISLALANA